MANDAIEPFIDLSGRVGFENQIALRSDFTEIEFEVKGSAYIACYEPTSALSKSGTYLERGARAQPLRDRANWR